MAEYDRAYEETGGLIIGTSPWWALQASWPLCGMTATHTAITFRVLGTKFDVPRQTITSIGRHRVFWLTGLRIVHRASIPRFVFFWSLSWDELRDGLRDMGYPVAD